MEMASEMINYNTKLKNKFLPSTVLHTIIALEKLSDRKPSLPGQFSWF
jgi:hypothetical protein